MHFTAKVDTLIRRCTLSKLLLSRYYSTCTRLHRHSDNPVSECMIEPLGKDTAYVIGVILSCAAFLALGTAPVPFSLLASNNVCQCFRLHNSDQLSRNDWRCQPLHNVLLSLSACKQVHHGSIDSVVKSQVCMSCALITAA